MVISIELYYSRFGALARPYIQTLGFNYNKVYNSFEDIILDFALNEWKLVSREDSRSGNEVVSAFCTFEYNPILGE